MIQLRTVRDEELTADELAELRAFLNAAYDHEFGDEDWRHARGGSHVLGLVGAELVAHAAVVPRNLRSGSRVWRTGYVEAVGVRQDQRGHGHGRTVMLKAAEHLRATYELGALSAGPQNWPFYERLGWLRWTGPTFVEVRGEQRRTAEDDGEVFVLPTPATGEFDRTEPLVCEWRSGDAW
ncbi:GNAT family N-acetyltransferase [Streptoalloteichus tenebrarius]|uniref:GNAT family N-acetyltransferase n=1 Tax=Streptoalloteichus tenebrarius (strain ATCC 17920 / DSM 40477 / JCM 4838 / CBS 697.72 / NBRC 16177 / NCIMB 11028 / NRRL B-12390 / A12253. 1 / ISP 5477) TaxID=1933 RepID=UPI0020A562EE|nr:GNAT family N-acetyltransferase [Streptoalloteichus tenebrarius]